MEFEFYFIIDQSMIEKYGMSETISNSDNHHWNLCNNVIGRIFISAGDALDFLRKNNMRPEISYAICKAFCNDKVYITVLNAFLMGNTLKEITVIVSETIWVKV